jgi:hypothetical protein
MKQYPKIPHWNKGPFGEETIAFFKNDGSNLRFEFSKNKNWYKFGTRNTMITQNDPNFGKGVDLFLNKYGEILPKIIENKYKKLDNFVVFCEYFGPNSFAGWHDPNDIMDIVLFDVSLYKRGFIYPYEFVNNFSQVDIPKIVYNGEYNIDFINSVRRNDYNLSEGLVCKGIIKTKNKIDNLYMNKVKTDSWLIKVKEKFGIAALKEELNGDKLLISEYEGK